MQTKVKICGVTDAKTAAYAIEQGADYIGLVFEASSPRFVRRLDFAQNIVKTVHQQQAQAVGVFRGTSIDKIKQLLKDLPIDFVQLHHPDLIQQGDRFDDSVRKIYAGSMEQLEKRCGYQENRDYLLVDHEIPGSGQQAKMDALPSEPFFLAGGLTVDNVQEKIQQYHPYAVDVSSSVEIERGKKDLHLIKTFIERVKQ